MSVISKSPLREMLRNSRGLSPFSSTDVSEVETLEQLTTSSRSFEELISSVLHLEITLHGWKNALSYNSEMCREFF